MSVYKISACLLDYPNESLWQAQDECFVLIDDDSTLTEKQKQSFTQFIRDYFALPLMDAQAEYYQTFDVGYTTSLLLFEHVYGDSRERGQAMVDLMNQYAEHGIELATKQLPDYLPIFLEYLSLLAQPQRHAQLLEIAPILRLLMFRLEKKHSRFVALFDLLYQLSGHQFDDNQLKAKVSQESSETTNEKLDQIWQEEQVRFQASTGNNKPQVNNATYYVNVGADRRSHL
ncbi:respiratory nitrate reductase chaperone NarJ [Orbus hercynius]|uniref:Respiratory nitrate reductase chaperone NarJ n=1 Tax=Orbus hercynius TaxID=593135 RepID=A0A495RK09_9GAMM|nr:nitrate reductase molybdenum cofactor assembly chaperone [Orbus hercynius]RKS87496.1 respiratory nitrate reductase chaperone NarJ [Orbus hercynius]